MTIKNEKDKIIKEIMNLRTLIGRLGIYTVDGFENEDDVDKAQVQLNKIHDMIFNI